MRLLLKAMQHVNGFFEFDQVDGTKGRTRQRLPNLQDTRAAKTTQRLGLAMAIAELCQIQCKPELFLNALRHRLQVDER